GGGVGPGRSGGQPAGTGAAGSARGGARAATLSVAGMLVPGVGGLSGGSWLTIVMPSAFQATTLPSTVTPPDELTRIPAPHAQSGRPQPFSRTTLSWIRPSVLIS